DECVALIHSVTPNDRAARVVFGFYGSVEHAQEALHALRKAHFRRSGIVRRTNKGKLEFFHAGFSPANRMAAATAVAVLCVLIANLRRLDLWELVLAGAAGFSAPWFLTLQLGLGLPNRILRNDGRFVLPGENLVIVQE